MTSTAPQSAISQESVAALSNCGAEATPMDPMVKAHNRIHAIVICLSPVEVKVSPHYVEQAEDADP